MLFFPPFSDVGWLDVNKHREIGTKPNVMLLLHCVLARSDKLRSFFFSSRVLPRDGTCSAEIRVEFEEEEELKLVVSEYPLLGERILRSG